MLKKGWKLATNELLSIKKISILWGEEIPVPPSPYETLIIHYTPITTFVDSHACYLTHAHTHTFMLATDSETWQDNFLGGESVGVSGPLE